MFNVFIQSTNQLIGWHLVTRGRNVGYTTVQKAERAARHFAREYGATVWRVTYGLNRFLVSEGENLALRLGN